MVWVALIGVAALFILACCILSVAYARARSRMSTRDENTIEMSVWPPGAHGASQNGVADDEYMPTTSDIT